LSGFTSAVVLSDMAHRLMTIEASNILGWPRRSWPASKPWNNGS